jgi:DNA processing protein
MKNKIYFLALNRIHQVGPRTVAKLLTRWPNLEEMFRLSAQQLEKTGLSAKIAQSIAHFNFAEVDADLRWEETADNYLLTWEDANYPALLKEIYDPPPILYATGQLSCLQQAAIAIIGSRKPSVLGIETARRFACELASELTIVSGLALGIDAQAHRGCLEAGGKTIAVMGTGIDSIYPYQHRCLAHKIRHNGLLISEFSLKTPPKAGHFPQRNRIISGLSLAILVVEAAVRSGSLITARLALEQNRDVLAIPGSLFNPQARGCHQLLQEGAKLVTSSQDIIDELGLNSKPVNRSKATPSFDKEDENLISCVGFEITTIDQISARSGLSFAEIACNLATLELKGIVKAVPGGYIRCAL